MSDYPPEIVAPVKSLSHQNCHNKIMLYKALDLYILANLGRTSCKHSTDTDYHIIKLILQTVLHRQRATLAFMCSLVSAHLTIISPIFTMFTS